MRDNVSAKPDLTERIIEDEEIDNELLDEILDNEIDEDVQKSDKKQVETSEAEKVIRKKLNEEIDELGRYIQWAESIGIRHFNEARERLEKWADDMVIAAEKELKDTKAQIKTFNRQSRQAENLEQQREIQEKIKQLERKKRRQRQQIFDIEDEIMEKRDNLIDALEKRLEQKTTVDELFTIRWAVV